MDAWRMREGISGSGRTMSKIPKISVTVVLTQFTDTGQKKKKKKKRSPDEIGNKWQIQVLNPTVWTKPLQSLLHLLPLRGTAGESCSLGIPQLMYRVHF